MKIIAHVRYKWKLRKIDDGTAELIIKTFQDKTQEWCKLKNKVSDWRWLQYQSKQWMIEELKRVFDWSNENKKIA